MEKMKFQKITLFSGVMLALNSLIGSGWLFGAGTAAKVACGIIPLFYPNSKEFL